MCVERRKTGSISTRRESLHTDLSARVIRFAVDSLVAPDEITRRSPVGPGSGVVHSMSRASRRLVVAAMTIALTIPSCSAVSLLVDLPSVCIAFAPCS